jgi:hypothetical protein
MRIIVTTCKKYQNRAMPGFMYLFNKFWGKVEVDVLTDELPGFQYPSNFKWHVIDVNGEGWPVQHWSTGFRHFLCNYPHNNFVLFMDDFWLIKKVDQKGIESLGEYLDLLPAKNVLRIDLTSDRYMSGYAKDVGRWKGFDIIQTPRGIQYQMSLQTGLWNRELLYNFLRNVWTPWEVELQGTGLLNESSLFVYGTKNHPVKYANVFNCVTGSEKYIFDDLSHELQNELHMAAIL